MGCCCNTGDQLYTGADKPDAQTPLGKCTPWTDQWDRIRKNRQRIEDKGKISRSEFHDIFVNAQAVLLQEVFRKLKTAVNKEQTRAKDAILNSHSHAYDPLQTRKRSEIKVRAETIKRESRV